MSRNLGDPWDEIERLTARIRALEKATMLANASVGGGRLRFYDGGELLIEGGNLRVTGTGSVSGTFNVSGTLNVTGTTNLDGPVIIDGNTTVNGALGITGPTTITGNTTVNGALGITGPTTITGNTTISGALAVKGVTTLDNELKVVGGKITAGNVRIQGGKVYVGSMILDPASHSGYLRMPNGGEVLGAGSNLELYSGGSGAKNGLSVTPAGLSVTNVQSASNTGGLKWLAWNSITGTVYAVDPSVGGPAGVLAWPFPAAVVTSEFGPRESPGPGASTFHEGIDFDAGDGASIPAAGSGTVVQAGLNGGFGYSVKISHGSGIETLYAHMAGVPPVTVGSHVSRGQVIGVQGNTGRSFGSHLHFEVHVDGVPVNPRSKLPAA